MIANIFRRRPALAPAPPAMVDPVEAASPIAPRRADIAQATLDAARSTLATATRAHADAESAWHEAATRADAAERRAHGTPQNLDFASTAKSARTIVDAASVANRKAESAEGAARVALASAQRDLEEARRADAWAAYTDERADLVDVASQAGFDRRAREAARGLAEAIVAAKRCAAEIDRIGEEALAAHAKILSFGDAAPRALTIDRLSVVRRALDALGVEPRPFSTLAGIELEPPTVLLPLVVRFAHVFLPRFIATSRKHLDRDPSNDTGPRAA